MSRKPIPEKVRYLLFAKSAGRCEFDNCNEVLYEEGLTKFPDNFSEVAHIIGYKQKGPRGENVLDEEYRNNIDNLMMVCKEHHHLIDHHPELYPEDILRKMKSEHEKRIRIITDILPDRRSNIVFYQATVGDAPITIKFRDASDAMSSEGYYPAKEYPIDLGMSGNLKKDDDPKYWDINLDNLEEKFKRDIKPLLENNKAQNHFSLFAFAPMPLLIKLGALFSDKSNVDIYQLKKDPVYWKWETYPSDVEFLIQKPKDIQKLIALNLSLSASIGNERIYSTLGTNEVSIWKMDVADSEFPKNDHLRAKSQLIKFKRDIRKLLDEIKFIHGQDTEIHLFPAVPIAYAIELGRVRQSKADLPLIIYDQNNKLDGFQKVYRID